MPCSELIIVFKKSAVQVDTECYKKRGKKSSYKNEYTDKFQIQKNIFPINKYITHNHENYCSKDKKTVGMYSDAYPGNNSGIYNLPV